MIFNKLVRDNIPDIIKNNGEEAITQILDDEIYKKELDKKLLEEVNEYLKDDNEEEIADILEVIDAILDYKQITKEQITDIKNRKVTKKGAFTKRVYLIETK